VPPEPTLPRSIAALEDGRVRGFHLGGQIYVSRRGEAVVDRAFGEARPGEPMTLAHRMLWMSSTKPVSALAVLQLWERGRLRLDDPVKLHVPEFAVHGKDAITLRHLLTHTAGIRTLDTGWPQKTWDETVAEICALRPEPRWIPGEKAGYHMASSWFVLGEVVRRVSGEEFDRYVRREILEPLGMADCWIGIDPALFPALAASLAPVFDTGKEPPAMGIWHEAPRATRPNPGSNGYGPIRQLGRFYEALADGGREVVSPQTVEAMTARQRTGLFDQTFRQVMDWGLGIIPNPAIYTSPEDTSIPYAYGPHASRRACGHSGYRSSTAFFDPEHALVVAVAVNGTPSDVDHARRFRTLLATIYEELGLVSAAPSRNAGEAA
jgi:CubicO group peptidase (beta-lactamase class C family)